MASASPTSASAGSTVESIGVKNKANVGPGVSLNDHQRLLVASVLDLFEGRPTLKHLSLWQPTATFEDPIAVAQGYDAYAAQWYGLAALFQTIKIQRHQVTSGGNPLELSLSNNYVVKGINKEQLIDSVVRIHVAPDGRIEKVEDRWNDELPEGAVSQALRKLNGSVMSKLVKVPKTDDEDKKMQAERHVKTT
ncbi:hypothetical protein CDD81_7390 [Ophiocordyceps australis]|uniref:SnoaL-like domain-containing protein n=1 Tax=Ophiocordyceps australis TaxID=1399860 RepID=A0A2C5YA02_9HYPO|nr:hypothetical protein CDD81_7390 [Ophiocordyceps australis]